MKRISLGTLLALALGASSAQAALSRVWVSSKGVDGPSCGAAAAPCRQIKYALDNAIVTSGGEIVVYDSSAFSPFTVSQSVSIINDGAGTATIQQPNSGQSAIAINSASPIRVTLKGLSIDGLGSGGNGVEVTSSAPAGASLGGEVVILNCFIKNFAGNGVSIKPTLTGSGARPLMVVLMSDSTVLGNALNGMIVAPTIDVYYSIIRSTFEGNSTGLKADGANVRANGLAVESKFIRNSTTGISVTATGQAILTLKNSTALGNATDIQNNYIVNLLNNNTVGSLANTVLGYSDGSNNIESLTGVALTPKPQQ